jgi:hypothetical protein
MVQSISSGPERNKPARIAEVAARRWRHSFRVVCPLVVCVGCLFFSLGRFTGGAQNSDRILHVRRVVASKFELLGPDGKRAAVLEVTKDGVPTLSFYDEKRDTRLKLGLTSTGPQLSLYGGRDNQNWVTLAVEARDGSPRMTLNRSDQPMASAMLTVFEEGPNLHLGAEKRDGYISISVSNKQGAMASLYGPGGKRHISLSAGEPGPTIWLAQGDNSSQTAWTLRPDGSPTVTVSDDAGLPTAVFCLDHDGTTSVQRPKP